MTSAASRALARVALAAAVFVALPAQAAVPPAPTRWVTDEAAFLSEPVRQALDAKLEEYQRRTGHHVLVWISRTTGLVPIEDFAVSAFQAWRVGRKGIDDGVVLFLLADDRKVRIEVGYGLEGQVPDAIASRIIQDTIVPKIQAGDRDGAVQSGVDALLAAIEGRALAAERSAEGPPAPAGPRPASTAEKVFWALVLLGVLAFVVTNPSLALYMLVNILSSSGRGGGGWSSGGGYSGGGGGYSGGGGRSGGGGATGSW